VAWEFRSIYEARDKLVKNGAKSRPGLPPRNRPKAGPTLGPPPARSGTANWKEKCQGLPP